ncbi:MAG: DoxX family protein [Spirosomataceae bacterium]
MKNRKNLAYWIVTIFLCFGMTAGGLQQTFQVGGYNEIVTSLGYPLYMLSFIGIWKLLGVIVILIPGYTLVKEWAYAGFFFVMSGAFLSHFIAGQGLMEALPSIILCTATVLSWYLRPAHRKISPQVEP